MTKYVAIVEVIDPDTANPVIVEIRKTCEGGIMVGFDGSYLEQFDEDLFSPYDRGVTLIIPDNEE